MHSHWLLWNTCVKQYNRSGYEQLQIWNMPHKGVSLFTLSLTVHFQLAKKNDEGYRLSARLTSLFNHLLVTKTEWQAWGCIQATGTTAVWYAGTWGRKENPGVGEISWYSHAEGTCAAFIVFGGQRLHESSTEADVEVLDTCFSHPIAWICSDDRIDRNPLTVVGIKYYYTLYVMLILLLMKLKTNDSVKWN